MAHAPKWISATGDESVSAVAVRSLKARLEPVQEYLPSAALRSAEDIEYVHQLRVWTRRADAAIEMYRDLLPEWRAAWIEEQMARIRRATNDARDDDVFARRLAADKTSASARLLKRVGEHREVAQQSVLEVYERLTKKRGRFDRRVKQLLKRVRLRGKQRKLAEPTYRDWAEARLPPLLDEFFALAEGDPRDTESLHQFRIAGKHLRYAMELLSAAFCSDLRKKAYPLLETLQNRLGKVNDHASAMVRIQHWIDENNDSAQATYLAEMFQVEEDQLRASRRDFADWWSGAQESQLREAFDQILCDRGLAGRAK